MAITTIAGSPTANSRSNHLLDLATRRLRSEGFHTENIAVRELPAAALLSADTKSRAVAAALRTIEQANVVIIAAPLSKASYSGLLKSFLDLLPQAGLANKAVLIVATGDDSTHLLEIDRALRPVLAALGANIVIDSLLVDDSQFEFSGSNILSLTPATQERLDRSFASLRKTYGWLTGNTQRKSATPLYAAA